MPKIFLDYTISGSVKVEITTERVKDLNISMKEMGEFRKYSFIQDEFSGEIQKHLESGLANEEVNEFGIVEEGE